MHVITVPGPDRLGTTEENLRGVIPLVSMMLNYESGLAVYNERLEKNPKDDVRPIISIPIGSGNVATYTPSVGIVYCGAVADVTAFAKQVADIISAASYAHLQGPRALVSTPCMVTRNGAEGNAQTCFMEGKCMYEVPFDEFERNGLPARLVTVSNVAYRCPLHSSRAVFTWIFLPAKAHFNRDPENDKYNLSKLNAMAASIYFDNSGTFIGERELYRPLVPSDFNYRVFSELTIDCFKNEGMLVLYSSRPAEYIGHRRSFLNMLATASDYDNLPDLPKKISETLKCINPYCIVCSAPLSNAVVINGLSANIDTLYLMSSDDNVAVCYWCWGSLDPQVSSSLQAYKAPQLFDYAATCASDPTYTSLPLIGPARPIKKMNGGFIVSIAGGGPVIFTGKSLGSCPQVTDYIISQSQLPIFSNLNIAWKD